MAFSLGDFIKDYRARYKLSMDDFAEKSGLSKAYISMLEKNLNPATNKKIAPSIETYTAVAKATNSSLDEIFRIIDSEQLVRLSNKEPDLHNIPGVIPLHKATRIPILGTIACGDPIWADENYQGYFVVDSSIKADFCLYAHGDSMIDEGITDGDIVFLKKTSAVDNGTIAAVLIEDEATLKKVYKTEKGVVLQPCNSKLDPVVIPKEEAQNVLILGEMVGYYHST